MLQGEKITIQSRDGISSRITIFQNRDLQAAVAVLMPAMGVNASFYAPLIDALVGGGLNVVTADLRGHGESSIRPDRHTDFGYREMVKYDWPSIIGRTKALFPHSPMVLLGHSLGGQLSTLYMTEHPGDIDALILVGSPSLYYRHWLFPESLGLLFTIHFFSLVANVLGYFPGTRMGVGGTEAKTLVRNWARVVRKGRYDMIDPSIDYESHLKNLRVPTLALSFTDDGFAPKRAVDHLCLKMPHVALTRKHIAPRELGCGELGHFRWVSQSEQIVRMILSWFDHVI